MAQNVTLTTTFFIMRHKSCVFYTWKLTLNVVVQTFAFSINRKYCVFETYFFLDCINTPATLIHVLSVFSVLFARTLAYAIVQMISLINICCWYKKFE
jgi:hypothetical protein